MALLFHGCYEIEYLDLSNFNTSSVTEMSGMFKGCNNLRKIKGITNFNTYQVSDMTGLYKMFDECNDLEYIDISKFNSNSQIISKIIKRKLIKGN